MATATATRPSATDQRNAELFARAHAAGLAAMERITPMPMVVTERENPWDDTSRIVHHSVVMGGVCGFAWVTVHPGNSSFARWLVKSGNGRKSSTGGVRYRVRPGGQSLTLKEVFADAFAAVLNEDGVKSYPESRID